MTNANAFKSTFHRDGTVTYWAVFTQVWKRQKASRIPDRELMAMDDKERSRIARMIARRAA